MEGFVIREILKKSFLFASLGDDDFNRAMGMISGEIREFSKGDIIYSPEFYERKIGFVISGECEVCRVKHDKGRVKLNALFRGDSFGITTVFSSNSFPTYVYAKRVCKIVFLSEKELMHLIESFPSLTLEIIRFQNDKIAFLNRKLEIFSAGTVEEKLVCYLLDEYQKQASRDISLNRTKTADAIGVGRASLYRALDSLEELNVISIDAKKILVIDPEGLERIVK